MKKLLYIMSALLLLSNCTKESTELHNPEGNRDGNVNVLFEVNIPEAESMPTRAINENLITNLQLLVFDENGRFISRHQASLSGNNYTVTLPQSSNKRTVHFIANFNWSNFNDAAAMTKDEGELIAPLQSSDITFWQRVVLNGGISAAAFSTQTISLIRNMAKFSLVNNATLTLTNAKFALFNTASTGSVAPFNTTNMTFESVITEPAGVTFTNASTFGVNDIYTFERKNSTVTSNPTYVIIEGTYIGVTCYYKIDIIDNNKNMYDIQRNVWFKIIIEGVTLPGYLTMEAAKNAPASNNISASVLLQSYPTISDGAFVLSVDKTIVSFTSNGQTLNANATYKTVAGISMNSLVTITLIQDPASPVINGAFTYDTETGNLTAAINNIPANGTARIATIKIEAGVLSRTIRLILHAPFTFTNISITPAVINNVNETPATLKFTVPAEAEYLLPFNCYITSAYLTPNFGNIEVVYQDGIYKYKWKVSTVGEQTINFKTNTDNAAEMIFIDADLFQRGQVPYSNTNGSYRFSNVITNPSPVDFGIGKAVTLKFTVPLAGTYKIYTSNLNPVGGSIIGGIYTYIAVTAGEQIVNFTTNKQNIAERIKLTGTGFLDHAVLLKNQLVNISGKLTYRSSNTIINQGIITVLVGTKVVGMFPSTATGTYQASIEVNIGDILIYKYTASGTTYSATTTVTSANMTINLMLS